MSKTKEKKKVKGLYHNENGQRTEEYNNQKGQKPKKKKKRVKDEEEDKVQQHK